MTSKFDKRVGLKLHKAQSIVYRNSSRFRVVVAGRRFGKTKLAVAELIKEAGKKRLPKGETREVWYVAPTYGMARQIMWTEMMNSLPKSWIKGKPNETRMEILLKNNTYIRLRGADKPDSLRGVAIHFLVMDEFQDIKKEAWSEALRPTLASTQGRALFIGTPKSYNHLYDAFMLGQKEELQASGQWMSWQFPTIVSPFIPVSEIENAKNDMDEKSFQQEFLASFDVMTGQVYHAFDREMHVGNYKFNPKLPIWVGQDFNVDPMSTVIAQPQPNGEVWIVDEIYLFNSSTSEICDELERRYWRYLKQITVYPDPAGGNRASTRGESDLDIFRERGFKKLKYRKKHPPVADRINSVNRVLHNGEGVSTLKVDKKCVNLIESLEQTIYKPGTREVNKSLGKEHISDAIGYMIEIEFPLRKIDIAGISL